MAVSGLVATAVARLASQASECQKASQTLLIKPKTKLPQSHLPCPGETSHIPTDLSTVSRRDQPHSQRSIYRVQERPATLPQIYLPCPGETSHTPTDLSTVSWKDQPHSHRAICRVLDRPATLSHRSPGETSHTLTDLCPEQTSHTPTDLCPE